MKLLIPTAETIAAMQSGLRGEVVSFNTIEELMAELNREDDDDLPTHNQSE